MPLAFGVQVGGGGGEEEEKEISKRDGFHIPRPFISRSKLEHVFLRV